MRSRSRDQRQKAGKSVPSVSISSDKDSFFDRIKALDDKIGPKVEVYNYDGLSMQDEKIERIGPRPSTPTFQPRHDDPCVDLDLSLPVCSREGWPACVWEADLTNSGGSFPLKAVIFEHKNVTNSTFTRTGQYVQNTLPHANDLFNVTRDEWDTLVTKAGLLFEVRV